MRFNGDAYAKLFPHIEKDDAVETAIETFTPTADEATETAGENVETPTEETEVKVGNENGNAGHNNNAC